MTSSLAQTIWRLGHWGLVSAARQKRRPSKKRQRLATGGPQGPTEESVLDTTSGNEAACI
jgi:hypothetical protein